MSGRTPDASQVAGAPHALPFRRLALVLSGGGALGAYEIGVLNVLERAGIRPDVVAGVSIGAMNALAWLAHGMRTAPLQAEWLTLRPASVGMQWITLVMRWLGGLCAAFALLQLVLSLAGSRELSGAHWLWRRSSGPLDVASELLDATAWLVIAGLGATMMLVSRNAETWFAKLRPPADSRRVHRRFGTLLLVLLGVHVVVWIFGWPWPHRFSATTLLVLGLVWLANRPGRSGDDLRAVFKRLLPETGGRGLWSAAARRAVLERILVGADMRRVTSGQPQLVMSALAVDSGRICHFINWKDVSEPFNARIDHQLGEVVLLRDAEDMLRAAVACTAIPGVFEPVRIAGRDFVDAGGFSNQPLHVALAADADAALVVLLSPRSAPVRREPISNLLELAGRLLEVANWRDMQTELNSLPEEWTMAQRPSRICVVEPSTPLAGGVLGFDPALAANLIARGEADARAALERAGWISAGTA